jgi:signal transduction histidine kinase
VGESPHETKVLKRRSIRIGRKSLIASILRWTRDGLEADVRTGFHHYGQCVTELGSSEVDPRPPMLYGLTQLHWFLIDVFVAAVGVVASLVDSRSPTLGVVPLPRGALDISLVVLACAPIAVRRRFPLAVLVVVTGAIVALTALGRSPFALDGMVGVVIYMVATSEPRQRSVPALVLVEVALGGALAIAGARGFTGEEGLHSLLAAGACWFVGDSVAARRKYIAGLVEQAESRQITEKERRQQAIRAERVRIARELHDVVAHALAVITVKAGVAQLVMEKDPAEASSALKVIEESGRTAHDELRLVLGLLREDEEESADRAPAPALTDLKGLVEKVEAAGTPVDLRLTGSDLPVLPALEVSVYRIIQEALTNIVKHAPGAYATVRIGVSEREVRIEVTDNGETVRRPNLGTTPSSGTQHGLLGMRERVAAFGGTIIAERDPGVGFRIIAAIPLSVQQ